MKPVIALLVTLLAMPGALALVTDPIQDDAGSGHDAGDAASDATLLGRAFDSPDGSYTGLLVPVDDRADWFAFSMREAGPLALTVAIDPTACGLPLGGATQVVLWSPRGEPLAAGSAGCGAEAHLSADAKEPGLYRIQLAIPSPLPGAAAGANASPGPLGYGMDLLCHPWC